MDVPFLALEVMYSYNLTSTMHGLQWVSLATQSVGVGRFGSIPMLARISLVDFRGNTILDTYVRPTTPVMNYRIEETGIGAHHLEQGIPFTEAKSLVAAAISGKVVVGHSLWKDLYLLEMSVPAFATRDTALFIPYRAVINPNDLSSIIGLNTLVGFLMQRLISVHHQDSLENARATMDLYRSAQDAWEGAIDDCEWPCALPPPTFARCYT
ncbi:hypothetical protein BS47DRAFT_885102 [Hydnum rufescens UP504]|uniref:Exonuclease domain-containing protein n=1 Tax=Hydnum rufescens UP504 TaxID=1448309 RepID=A0A9P6AYD4_9AGAM|nr:hypothetical protein BS47DRAFT_885102 [Hydnum rufescens UP504]